jgi:branched-chain amino acid transport system substrate-binding protein
LENLNLDKGRLKALGLEGFTLPIKVSCEDHETGGPVLFQQWDGTKWSIISDWVPTMRDVVRPMIEAAAAKHAKENNIPMRDCSKE